MLAKWDESEGVDLVERGAGAGVVGVVGTVADVTDGSCAATRAPDSPEAWLAWMKDDVRLRKNSEDMRCRNLPPVPEGRGPPA